MACSQGKKKKKKKKKRNNGTEQPNQESIRTLGEKKITNTWEYWKRTPLNRDERKSKKRIPKSNKKKKSQNQILRQKSHQRNKHPGGGGHHYKILRTILKIDEGGTKVNELKDKEIDDDAQIRKMT